MEMFQIFFFYHIMGNWMHRNHVIFQNIKCNPTHILELANKIFHKTLLYQKGSDLIDVASIKALTRQMQANL